MKNLIVILFLILASIMQAQISSMQSVKKIATLSSSQFDNFGFTSAYLIEGYIYIEANYGSDGYIIQSDQVIYRNPPNAIGLLDISNNRAIYLTGDFTNLQIVEVNLFNTSGEAIISSSINKNDFGYSRFDWYDVDLIGDNPNWDPLFIIFSDESTCSIYQTAGKERGQWVYSSKLKEWIWIWIN